MIKITSQWSPSRHYRRRSSLSGKDLLPRLSLCACAYRTGCNSNQYKVFPVPVLEFGGISGNMTVPRQLS